MATNLLLEGGDPEALLRQAYLEGGREARIVRAEKVRRGGVWGFFAREIFEVAVEIPEDRPVAPPAAPAPVARPAAAPTAPGPAVRPPVAPAQPVARHAVAPPAAPAPPAQPAAAAFTPLVALLREASSGGPVPARAFPDLSPATPAGFSHDQQKRIGSGDGSLDI